MRDTAQWSSGPLCKRCMSNSGAGLQHKEKKKTDFNLKAERKHVPAETLLKNVLSLSRSLLSIIDCFLFSRLPWLTKSTEIYI